MILPLLDQLPCWTTTGVGSLPHAGAHDAVEYLTLAYGVPFCPQLPRHDGDMVAQWLRDPAARPGWTADRPAREPVAWDAFLADLRARPPAHGVVKLQVTGPVTLACAIDRAAAVGGPVPDAASATRAAELGPWLATGVVAQVAALRELGLDAVVVVDEPALALCGVAGIEEVWEPLRSVGGAWGLHLCCDVPWDIVDAAEPDLLSVDLAFTQIDERAAASLRAIAARGGWVAWGAIAAHRPEHALHGVRRMTAALDAVPETSGRSLLTPSCGTGLVSVERERQVAVALRDVAASMRRREQREG